jgi:hypothetical protein
MNRISLLMFVAAVVMPAMSQGGQLPTLYSSYSVQISSEQPNEPVGSGFLLQASNSVYLVTARHVLFQPTGPNVWKLKRNTIGVSAFSNPSPTNELHVLLRVDLDMLLVQNEVRYSTNRDIALVRLEQCSPENKAVVKSMPGVEIRTVVKMLTPTPEDLLTTALDASLVGADVFLFGYPSSIGIPGNPQIDSTHPLLRKGIIAGLNPSRGTMIVDCPVYQGNSGGPVVMRQQISMNQWHFRVVGIAVEWIPFLDVWESKRFNYANQAISNSGYSVVEPAEAILSLVWR